MIPAIRVELFCKELIDPKQKDEWVRTSTAAPWKAVGKQNTDPMKIRKVNQGAEDTAAADLGKSLLTPPSLPQGRGAPPLGPVVSTW